ncbi:hypothetical protein L873DRAFT_1671996, partial [Choiromyces venosus 120613-1]
YQTLQEKRIGTCGTTRVNRVDYPSALQENSLPEWNSIDDYAVSLPPNQVLCFYWMDNNIIRMLTTVYL